jgi:hypothetical protein
MLKITHPLTGDEVQVANADFDFYSSWDIANQSCQNLGNGWRLPTLEELSAMHTQLFLKKIGNFSRQSYWSSLKGHEGHYIYYFDERMGEYGSSVYPDDEAVPSIRAVRNIL